MTKEMIKNFALLTFRIITLVVLIGVIVFGTYGAIRYIFTGGI